MRTYIEIGKIVNTHGLLGTVKAEAWCDTPAVLARMKRIFIRRRGADSGYDEYRVVKASVQKEHVLLTLETVDSIEKATAFRNVVLFAHRDDIPVGENAHLIDDLKGLPVIDVNNGVTYGTLRDVIKGAASDIYEIKTGSGTVLVPAVKEFIKKIDIENGIYISPIGGMFDDN